MQNAAFFNKYIIYITTNNVTNDPTCIIMLYMIKSFSTIESYQIKINM